MGYLLPAHCAPIRRKKQPLSAPQQDDELAAGASAAPATICNSSYMPTRQSTTAFAPEPQPARRRWLLLAHQIPATPSKLRVKTWRRLQELGAVPVKQSVYALPDSPQAREDFEWLRVEIEGAGGEAVIFAAEHLGAEAETALVDEFKRTRHAAYTELAAELQRLRPKAGMRGASDAVKELSRYRERFNAIERIDFFGGAGRDRVESLLAALEPAQPDTTPATGRSKTAAVATYQNRLWITRPRPGVDRMASAWLIRRFIDPAARFDFVTDPAHAPVDAVPFDMYGTGFGHHGDRCTFEGLVSRFGIDDAAVVRLGRVVHDLDLKDGKFGAAEAATLGAAIDGLQMSCADDRQLLEQGIILFEAMYRSFSQQAQPRRQRSGRAAARRPARR
jgi:hypothetical protein